MLPGFVKGLNNSLLSINNYDALRITSSNTDNIYFLPTSYHHILSYEYYKTNLNVIKHVVNKCPILLQTN